MTGSFTIDFENTLSLLYKFLMSFVLYNFINILAKIFHMWFDISKEIANICPKTILITFCFFQIVDSRVFSNNGFHFKTIHNPAPEATRSKFKHPIFGSFFQKYKDTRLNKKSTQNFLGKRRKCLNEPAPFVQRDSILVFY